MLKKTTPNNNLPYQKEYEEAQFFVVKSRLRLFCFLTLILYISASIVSLVQNPQAFKKIEIASWVFLTTAACVALYANTRVKTLLKAKINAFIFSGLLVLCVLGLFLLYKEYIPTSESIFSITLFAISFIIPWGRFAVFAMGLCHLLAYAFLYIWSNLVIHKGVYAPFTTNEFIDGLTYLVIALVICLVIKKNDRDMAKKNFILMKNLQKKNEQMERELELAREVHKMLIPQSTTTDNAVIAVNYVPVSTVGGDYASFHVTAEGNLF